MLRHPAAPYVLPMAVFFALLIAAPYLPLPVGVEQLLRVAILSAALWFFSRGVIDFRCATVIGSVLIGIVVFLIWIAPDTLIPGWRQNVLFNNSITGGVKNSIALENLSSPSVLLLRCIRAVILVPIIEELFWRGWLMRWLIDKDFESVPLGKYAPAAFWITAALFAAEHGPYWEVGLIAGVIYNAWIVRTRRLGDCILAHAVTNGVLSGYVIFSGKWEYWM